MVKKKKTETSCDFCNNLVYDDEIESYVCDVNMDEDDYARFLSSSRTYCPYYQSNDEYKIVRHQMYTQTRNGELLWKRKNMQC